MLLVIFIQRDGVIMFCVAGILWVKTPAIDVFNKIRIASDFRRLAAHALSSSESDRIIYGTFILCLRHKYCVFYVRTYIFQ